MLGEPSHGGWRAWLLRVGALRSTALITAAAVAISLAITYLVTLWVGEGAILSMALGIATAVPLIVAPVVSHFGLRLLYEVEDARHRMREAAIRDGLTNLYNRRFFMERLRAEVERARREGSPLSLVMIDVDHFKLINDRRGHAVGDEVLEAIGTTLVDALGPCDVSARYGGEEFVVLLPGLDTPQAAQVAERVRGAIGRLRVPSFGDAAVPHVTASLGVAGRGAGDDTLGALLSRADQAMYRAKAGGRDRCVVFATRERVETAA